MNRHPVIVNATYLNVTGEIGDKSCLSVDCEETDLCHLQIAGYSSSKMSILLILTLSRCGNVLF